MVRRWGVRVCGYEVMTRGTMKGLYCVIWEYGVLNSQRERRRGWINWGRVILGRVKWWRWFFDRGVGQWGTWDSRRNSLLDSYNIDKCTHLGVTYHMKELSLLRRITVEVSIFNLLLKKFLVWYVVREMTRRTRTYREFCSDVTSRNDRFVGVHQWLVNFIPIRFSFTRFWHFMV